MESGSGMSCARRVRETVRVKARYSSPGDGGGKGEGEALSRQTVRKAQYKSTETHEVLHAGQALLEDERVRGQVVRGVDDGRHHVRHHARRGRRALGGRHRNSFVAERSGDAGAKGRHRC